MLYIQTEGGGERGFGHITRSIALYQAFKEIGLDAWLLIDLDKGTKNAVLPLLKGVNYSLFDIKNSLDYTLNNHYYVIDTYQKVKGVKKHNNMFMLTDQFTYDKPLVRRSFWKIPRRKPWYDKKLDMTQATGLDEKTVYKMMSKYKELTVSGGQSFLEAFAIRNNNFGVNMKNKQEIMQVGAVKVKPGYDTSIKCAKAILKELYKYDSLTPNYGDYREILRLRNSKDVRKQSINKKRIKWVDHVKHMDQFRNEYTIIRHKGNFAGFMRVTKNGQLSIAVSPEYKGLGASDMLMRIAKRKSKLSANVYRDNVASMKFFEKHGFHKNPYVNSDISLVMFFWSK